MAAPQEVIRPLEPVTEKVKYLTTYRKASDGSWKATQDMNNADGPATAAVK